MIPEEFVSIPMDAMLIGQVLTNLLENAVYHAKGMTRLQLQVKTDNGQAIFGVLDDGCGISQEQIKQLFTGYQERKQTPVDGNRNNMGIGLSVCAAIIKAHGGRIWAENKREGGAAFYFTLEME